MTKLPCVHLRGSSLRIADGLTSTTRSPQYIVVETQAATTRRGPKSSPNGEMSATQKKAVTHEPQHHWLPTRLLCRRSGTALGVFAVVAPLHFDIATSDSTSSPAGAGKAAVQENRPIPVHVMYTWDKSTRTRTEHKPCKFRMRCPESKSSEVSAPLQASKFSRTYRSRPLVIQICYQIPSIEYCLRGLQAAWHPHQNVSHAAPSHHHR